jgi:mRNA interferase RelE/StbE
MPYVAFAFTERALAFLEGLPPKIRKQVAKRAKNLIHNPHPPSSKRLIDVETDEGDPVFRERSGDYRILYIVRSGPDEVIVLDIGHRKEIYRMGKTKTDTTDDLKIDEASFDEIMAKALGTPPPEDEKSK